MLARRSEINQLPAIVCIGTGSARYPLMNTKCLLIVVAIVTVDCLLAAVSPPIFVFFSLAALLFGTYIGIRAAVRWLKKLPYLQEAQSVSQIRRVEYFSRVPGPQLENLLLAALTAQGYVLLGDPLLGRSHGEGCAWRSGKRAGVLIQQERPLQERDLASIGALRRKYKVDTVLVFSPFSKVPQSNCPGVEILAGQKFLSWMSVLDGVRPVNIDEVGPQKCPCGAPQEERVSRAGEPLLICSRRPDCREAPRSVQVPAKVPFAPSVKSGFSQDIPFPATLLCDPMVYSFGENSATAPSRRQN